MLKKNDSFNKIMNGQTLLFILFVIYIIFNVQTPDPLANIIDSTLGYVIIIALFAFMAVKSSSYCYPCWNFRNLSPL